ncbi:hypothetical protein AVEN_165032-1 [Araneus ventricosus]|uniref:Uncharacterized protein n=1 Tax=Araneus ventricosus TaxID=182803 RepID=A0A4Y2GKP1_ARAVE|nr:hypothetical protein AVEN_165032-1 [Araneus ventricosus]
MVFDGTFLVAALISMRSVEELRLERDIRMGFLIYVEPYVGTIVGGNMLALSSHHLFQQISRITGFRKNEFLDLNPTERFGLSREVDIFSKLSSCNYI